MPRQALTGFTLVELMITITVLAVLAAIAAPSFVSMLERQRLNAATENLFVDLQHARSEAIKRNKLIFFNLDADNPSDWCYGIDESDQDCDCLDNACKVGGVAMNTTSNGYKDIQLVNGDQLTFNSRLGLPNNSQRFTLRVGDSGPERSIDVNAVGQVRMN